MGAGQVSKMGGTARLSAQVAQAWRVHALAAEFAARGLAISWEQAEAGGYWVRTSYSSTLVRLEAPSFLDGPRLRLWFLASGRLEQGDEPAAHLRTPHPALAIQALAPLGLAGEIVNGSAIRLAGEAKLRRLSDLIGERPDSAPVAEWPITSRPSLPATTAPRQSVARPRRHGEGEPLWPFEPAEIPEVTEPDEATKRRAPRAAKHEAEVGDLAAKRREKAAAEEAAGTAASNPRRARAAG